MSKSSKITASELVLSAIFFLQQKNGVTAKDITKFICEKRGCRQSLMRSEVKKALERATENGIFSKKRGLYRIESGFGKNKISIKVNRGAARNKKLRKMKRPTSVKPQEEDTCMSPVDAPVFAPVLEAPSFSRKESHSRHACPGGHILTLNDGLQAKASLKRVLMEQTKCAKNVYDEDEDEDEDFFEEDDDEDDIDYFADDQFPTAADAVKEYPPSDPEPDIEKKKDTIKRKLQSRSKSRTKGKSKKRKLSKPRRKSGKRKRTVVVRKCQKKNREPEASDDDLRQDGENEYGPDGEDDENMELDSQAEDNDYGGEDENFQNEIDLPEGSIYDMENEENERNRQDYDYGDEDYLSDEEYLKREEEASKAMESKVLEKGDGILKREEEGDQKDVKQPNTTTNVKVNQNSTAEGKVTSDMTKPTTPKTQEAANQDRKSKPIRSSSLFSSFKKKNESKNSPIDRKQVKSRM